MDSSSPSELDGQERVQAVEANTNTVQETPDSVTANVKRAQLQKPLLVFVVLAICFAGWYAWAHRSEIKDICYNRGQVYKPGEAKFNSADLTISALEIHSGGVGKDGIPALTNPEFMTANEATYMKPTDRMAGVIFDGEARAYPLKMMDKHEAVNDQIGETSFVVTYCPLCDSLAVYNRKGTGGDLEIGISGLLYNSNVLLYDRTGSGKTDGLWSQMMSQAISGSRVNEKLITLPVELTTWEDWKKRHPDTKVLSTSTGFQKNYQDLSYADYFSSDTLMFGVNKSDDRLPKKTPLLGIWVGDEKRAYPVTAFAHLTQPQELEQEFAGKKFTLAYNPQAKTLRVVKSDEGMSWMYSFWFAWYAFHPETELYSDPKSESPTESDVKQPAVTPEKAEKK